MRSTLFLGLLLVACGGSTDTELFTPPNGQQGTDASVQKDTSVDNPDSTVNKDANGLPDTSTIMEAGPDTSTGITSKIQCGNSQCTPVTEVCCRTGFPQQFMYQCVGKGKCTGQGSVTLDCSQADNCPNPGDVCCAALVQQGNANVATDTRCTPPNQCQGNSNVIVCDPNANNNCPNGGNCSMSTITLPGYDICK